MIIHNWFCKYSWKRKKDFNCGVCIWETFISRFPETNNELKPRFDNSSYWECPYYKDCLFSSFAYALYIWLSISLIECFAFCTPANSLHNSRSDLCSESRVLSEIFHEHKPPSWGRQCPVSRIQFPSLLILSLLLKVAESNIDWFTILNR